MFAPGAGRWLVPVAVLLAAVGALDADGVLPVRLVVAVLVGAGAALWIFLAWFFRDPERTIGPGIVSAADGRVQAVVQEADRWRISVFMNVTDVHVNRFPLDGRVVAIASSGSGFRPAYGEDAAHNVQRSYDLDTDLGPVRVVQLTGIVARRLVSLVASGDARKKGDRLGMILLGSRVDVYLPAARTRPSVSVGDRVRAGASTIAEKVP